MRTIFAILVMFALFLGGVVTFLLTAPPHPFTLTVGTVPEGSRILPVESVAALRVGETVVIDAPPRAFMANIDSLSEEDDTITLSVPVPFGIEAGAPATVARRAVATPVAVFEDRVALRRFPRSDSRVFAYSQPGMRKDVIVFAGGWVKIAIRPPTEGWVLAERAKVDGTGVVPEATFRMRAPIRRSPYADESLIRWEGRVVARDQERTPDGDVRYVLRAADRLDRIRTFQVTRGAWQTFHETDYIVLREGRGIAKTDVPLGFTEMGRPYEVVGRQGDWIRIQLQDQAWLPQEACAYAVRYSYSLTRRQVLNRRLRDFLRGIRWPVALSPKRA